MALPSVTFVRISEQQRNDLLDNGFDPPGDSILPDHFQMEIRRVCNSVQAKLSEVWRHDAINVADFHIHTSSEDDRMLCVEVGNVEIIDCNFLRIAHTAVAELAEGYCVDFCNDWWGLKLDSDQLHPDFNIFITKQLISIYSESDDLLRRLGISETLPGQWA